jgi:hypothetical protein
MVWDGGCPKAADEIPSTASMAQPVRSAVFLDITLCLLYVGG